MAIPPKEAQIIVALSLGFGIIIYMMSKRGIGSAAKFNNHRAPRMAWEPGHHTYLEISSKLNPSAVWCAVVAALSCPPDEVKTAAGSVIAPCSLDQLRSIVASI